MVAKNPMPTFGRYAEIPVDQMTTAEKQAYDYVVQQRGQAPGPYKIWIQNTDILNLMVPVGVYFKKHSSLNDAEREVATNLVVAHIGAAFPISEHEGIGEAASLDSHKTELMIAGLPTSFDDPRQQIIYEVTSAMLTTRYMPMGMYKRAIELLGDKGLTDLTVLIGYYCCVGFTTIAYDVPSLAPGLER
jgi:4-carboxymuconolactone decarboxylase